MSEPWGPRGRPERCSEEIRQSVSRMDRAMTWTKAGLLMVGFTVVIVLAHRYGWLPWFLGGW